jgi:drug/metabolite transporter (DMT)-like permease
LLFTGYLLQTLGLRWTTAAKSGFITGLYIVLVPLVSAIVYRNVPHWAEIAGVLLAGSGLAMLTLTGLTLEMGVGDLLTVGCAVAYAIHIVVLGHYSKRMDHSWLAVLQIGTCGVIGLGTFWWMEPVFIQWSSRVWIALGVTSLLATALAFAVQTWAQRHTSATRAAIIFSLEPVFAWATAFLVAGEVLTGRSIVGAFLILAGILLVELKPSRLGGHQSV